jgi:hypothetical protein
MVIGSNAVPAAITQVDARIGRKFTAHASFLRRASAEMLKGGAQDQDSVTSLADGTASTSA